MPISDSQLILDFQRGDENALLFFWNGIESVCLIPPIISLAMQMLPRMWRKKCSSRYTPQARVTARMLEFTTWLYRITANTCFDEMRKRKRLRFFAPSEIPESTPDESDSPEARLESSELTREVKAAIAQLPDNQRMAVILQRYEDLSYEQISDVMKIRVSAIESLLFRAKKSLRSKLSAYVENLPLLEDEKITHTDRKYLRCCYVKQLEGADNELQSC